MAQLDIIVLPDYILGMCGEELVCEVSCPPGYRFFYFLKYGPGGLYSEVSLISIIFIHIGVHSQSGHEFFRKNHFIIFFITGE
jgi:hypothetical protein